MMQKLVILYQFDDKYAPYAGISMTSLFANNANCEILVYCAGMDVSEQNRSLIEQTVRNATQQIKWLDVTESIQKIQSMGAGSWNGSIATWIKMFVLEDLPQEIDRILYIDCDTLILGQLNELFTMDMENYPIGAVYDSVARYNRHRLNTGNYYNAGIMLINLVYLRQKNLQKKMLGHLEENISRYTINDQDLMNDFFDGHILCLPMKYNVQGFHMLFSQQNYFRAYEKDGYYTPMEVQSAKEHPVILHFFRTMGSYPWEKGATHPMKKLYREWKQKSLWKDMNDIKRQKSLVFGVERVLYYMLPGALFARLYRWIIESILNANEPSA